MIRVVKEVNELYEIRKKRVGKGKKKVFLRKLIKIEGRKGKDWKGDIV